MKRNVIIKLMSVVLVFTMIFAVTFAIPVKADEGESIGEGTTEKGAVIGTVEEETLVKPGDTIEPQWRVTDHKGEQCDYVISQLNLSSSQGTWIKETCAKADDTYSEVRGFHARNGSNYLANLNALFMFARLVGTQNKTQTILNSMPNISANDKTDVEAMCKTVQKYLESKGSISKENKQYLVYGFAIHLVGDIYAHRILVKKTCVTNWGKTDTSTTKYFQTRDFDPTKLAEFKSLINEGKLYTVKIKQYMHTDNPNFVYNINYTKDGKKTTTNQGLVYIDNKTFMPKRFSAAKQASVSFMTHVRKSGSSFSDVGFYRDTYSLTIENFAAYKSSIS